MTHPARNELAQFQSALLDHLDSSVPLEELHESLMTDPKLASYRGYIQAMEPRMLEIAAELTRKWGVRKSGPASQ